MQEHRIAWARPVSKGGTCHLSRGFPDELELEPKQFEGLLGHPAVGTLHTVTGFNNGIADDIAKEFLLQPSASRLRSIEGLTKGMVESLSAPLTWRSVGLSFPPAREHREHLMELEDLTISMQLRSLTSKCFEGLTGLKKLKVGRAAEGTFEPLIGLESLEVTDFRSTNYWASELRDLERLQHLKLRSTISSIQLKGLRLKKLECWTSSELDVEVLLAGLPELKELRLWCGTDAATRQTLAKLLASERIAQLDFVSAGIFQFARPKTPQASMEVRAWEKQKLHDYAPAMELVPASWVPKVVVRPLDEDPWSIAGPPPQGFEEFRKAAKMPVELEWY